MIFALPYPPSINHYWRRVGNKTLISREGRRFRQDATIAIGTNHAGPMDGRLAVTIYTYQPDNRRRDLDNVLKALLDACTAAGVWRDDSQIDSLRIVRRGIGSPPRVLVSVRPMDRTLF